MRIDMGKIALGILLSLVVLILMFGYFMYAITEQGKSYSSYTRIELGK